MHLALCRRLPRRLPCTAMTGPPPALMLAGKVDQATLNAVEGFTLQQLQAISLADLEGLGLRREEARRLFLALRENAGSSASLDTQAPLHFPPACPARSRSREMSARLLSGRWGAPEPHDACLSPMQTTWWLQAIPPAI